MADKTNDITKKPYAAWLEQTLREISELPIRGIILAGVLEGEDAYTTYYNTTMGDKLLIAGAINQDAMIDTLVINGYIEEDDSDDEEDTDGEEEE